MYLQTASLIPDIKVGVAHKEAIPHTEVSTTVLLGSYALYDA